jgi:hypothetical protein
MEGKVEPAHVRKVGWSTVHEMADGVDEHDEYSTVCGELFYVTESDLTSDGVTCKRCIVIQQRHQRRRIEGGTHGKEPN